MTKSLSQIRKGDRLKHSTTGLIFVAAEDSAPIGNGDNYAFPVVNRVPVDYVAGPADHVMELADDEVEWPEELEVA